MKKAVKGQQTSARIDRPLRPHDPIVKAKAIEFVENAFANNQDLDMESVPPAARSYVKNAIAGYADKRAAAVMRKAEAKAHEQLRVKVHDKELASRIVSRRRLIPFVQRFFPAYKAGWVHHDIARRLERFVLAVEAEKSPRLLLLMPPRHGKSLLVSQFLIAWVLGRFPGWEFISSSYNVSLPLGFSRKIRDLMRDPSYQSVFPEAVLNPESQAVEEWLTTRGGGYRAAGVGGGITGKGAHIFVVDDPVKNWEEADSPTTRANTWEWWLSTAYTRLSPGGGVLGIQTWWNDDDWAGRIQQTMNAEDGEQYEIVKYPAVNDIGDEYLLPDERIEQFPPELVAAGLVPEGSRLLRPKNSALHPERYNIEALDRIRKNYIAASNVRMWSALYQQNPVPDEGAFFRREMIKIAPSVPPALGRHVYQAWDFAITEKAQNDWIVGVTVLQDEYDNVFVTDMMRFKSEDAVIIVDAIIDFHIKHTPWLIGFEDGQIFKSIKAILVRRAKERGVHMNYETLTPFTDKRVRAGPLRGRMQMGKFYMPEGESWCHTMENELLRFPAGKHDDIVDALAWAVRLVLAHAPPRIAVSKKLVSWKDKLNMGRADVSHMAA
jgi:predicted phage terminase large subunit-like protein